MLISKTHITALALRLGFGLYMILGHGLSKFQTLMGSEEIGFPALFGLSPKLSLALAVFTEFIAPIFVIIGFKTRIASSFVIMTMLVAMFMIHGSDPWFMMQAEGGSKEPAALYMLGFLAIFLLGPGKYALDSKFDRII